jgi:myosin heavy subunit
VSLDAPFYFVERSVYMADLKIKITGTLDNKTSKTEIDKKIKELEGQLEKVNLKIAIDDKVTKTLSDLSKAMENHKKIAQDLNRVIKEEKTITKEADGTIREKIKQHLKSGEIIEKEIKKINEKNKAMKDEEAEIGKLISQYDKLGQKQKEVTRLNAKEVVTGGSTKYRDGFTDTTYKTNKNGEVTSVTTTQNLDQERKATETLTASKQKLREQLQLLNNDQKITQSSLDRINNAINTSNDVAQLKRLEDALTRVNQRSNINNSLTNYKRQAEIQVNALQNNPNKIISGAQQTQLTSYLNSVNALNARTPQLEQRMRQLALDFREVSSQAVTAGRNTMSFGQAFSTAMQKFPVWMAASTAFYQSFNFFKDGISYVLELNKALTEVSIVTGQNQQQVAQLGEGIIN